MTDATVPIEKFCSFISEEIYNRPEYHQQIAQLVIPSTYTMVSFSAEQSNRDLFTDEQQFALVIYAYKSEDDDYAYVAAQAEADGRRRDWNFGRLHVIRRSYTEPQQYGWLLWGIDRPYSTTLDVWFKQTLWTFRIGKPWE